MTDGGSERARWEDRRKSEKDRSTETESETKRGRGEIERERGIDRREEGREMGRNRANALA